MIDELPDAGAMTAVDSAIVDDVAKRVDVSDRRDLRRRLADGLEEWLLKHRAHHQLLPSARHFSDAWGVHRATVQGAFEILVKTAFARRRRTLENNLRDSYANLKENLRLLNIEGKRRAETLSVVDFARLSRTLRRAMPA